MNIITRLAAGGVTNGYVGESIADILDEQSGAEACDRNPGRDFDNLELHLSRVWTDRTRRDPRRARASPAAREVWMLLSNTDATPRRHLTGRGLPR